MKPRELLCTIAAILVFGLAPLAGSQPDQKGHDGKGDKKPDQGQQAPEAQRQPPGQARKQQPAPAQRQQPARQRQAPPRQASPRQAPQQRQAPGQYRQAPGQSRQQPSRPVRQPAYQAPRTRPPASNLPQRIVGRDRNRQLPAPRNVTPTPVPPRTSVSRTEQRTIWPRYRARSWNTEHRTWIQRGGYRGYRIPTSRFTLYFGRPHRFRLSSFQIRIYESRPEFYADGYWFTLLDPIPEYWSDDWYDTDYCTVVEMDDGYYLLDESYPDVLLAVDVRL